jgi:hypothetical protein
MNLRFKCPTKACASEQWLVEFDTNQRHHRVICIKCGGTSIIELLFSKKKEGENDKPIDKPTLKPVNPKPMLEINKSNHAAISRPTVTTNDISRTI